MFQMALGIGEVEKQHARFIIGVRKSENTEDGTNMNIHSLRRWSIGDLLRNLDGGVSNSEAAFKCLALL